MTFALSETLPMMLKITMTVKTFDITLQTNIIIETIQELAKVTGVDIQTLGNSLSLYVNTSHHVWNNYNSHNNHNNNHNHHQNTAPRPTLTTPFITLLKTNALFYSLL
jgi:hypothetical protein